MTLAQPFTRLPSHDGEADIRAGLRASGLRIAAGAAAALVLAHLTIPGRPATLCPLRALTGIPCPLCGGTTAAVRIGHLDFLGALRANPVVVIAALVIAAVPAGVAVRKVRHLAPLPGIARQAITVAVILAVVFSEIWQLFRFGIF